MYDTNTSGTTTGYHHSLCLRQADVSPFLPHARIANVRVVITRIVELGAVVGMVVLEVA